MDFLWTNLKKETGSFWNLKFKKRYSRKQFGIIFLVAALLLLTTLTISQHRNGYEEERIRKVSEYEESFQFILDHLELCGKDFGASLPLLIVVTTGVSNFKAREVVRNTWGGYAVNKGAKVIFILGSTHENDVQKMVEMENNDSGDIVQARFLDTYRNLTLKTVSMMKWISDHCSKVKAVLKVDDDVVVNTDNLFKFLNSTSSFSNLIVGKVFRGANPFRYFGKWKMSKAEYEKSTYPNYVAGPSYIFSGEDASRFYRASLSRNYLFLEDVFMTGIVAQNLSFQRIEHPDMLFFPVEIDPCEYRRIISSHKQSSEAVLNIWMTVNNNIDVVCDACSIYHWRHLLVVLCSLVLHI